MKFLVALCVLAASANAQVGSSGVIDPSGRNIQFSHDFANNIVLIGPSGIVTRDGTNLQLTAEQAALHVAAPAEPTPVVPVSQYVAGRVVGPSGIVNENGPNVQFSHDFASNIVLIGPSGIVTKDGNNMQFRQKRSARAPLVGSGGIVFPDGQLRQFAHAGVHIVLEGPSGYVLSNGENVQKRSKRSLGKAIVGAAGIITPSGKLIQLKHGVTVVVAGPSGAVLSDGSNIQY